MKTVGTSEAARPNPAVHACIIRAVRFVLYLAVPLVAAVASIANIVFFWLENLMDPAMPPLVHQSAWAAIAVIVLAFAAAAWAMRGRRAWVPVLAVVVMVVAGFVPRGVDMVLADQRQAAEQKDGAEAEMEFQMAFLEASDDVAERIDEKRPMSAEEGLALLEFAADSDLSWRSLPDHSREAFALVQQALDAGILDPDALTTGAPVADSGAITLILMFYEARIRPGAPSSIDKQAWQLLQMLLLKDPDLSAPDAEELRAVLEKTPVIGEGRFVRLE
jgi:hypothetical protein